MVPGVGIEPTTLSSSGLRSTTELPRLRKDKLSTVNMVPCSLFLSIKIAKITYNNFLFTTLVNWR
jgi:hypothetical protein